MAPFPGQRSHSSKSSGPGSSKTKSWISEKVCQVGKNELRPCGIAWVDDDEAISEDLVDRVAAKTFALRMPYVEYDIGDEDESMLGLAVTHNAQVGLIEEGTWPDAWPDSRRQRRANCSPCRMWTAKHNVTTEEVKGTLLKFVRAHIVMDGNPYIVDFDEVLHEDITQVKLSGCTSRYGLDICKTSKTYTRRMYTEKSKLFQRVASAKIPVGTKIGIAVFNDKEPVTPPIGGADARMFGRKNDTVIHTGEIKEVFEDYFLHNINTIHSYSGAVVFLLDREQPAGIPRTDYGKACAIHAGGYPMDGVHRNIAFLLN